MSNLKDLSIPRRTVLKGAAGVAAVSASGGTFAQLAGGSAPFTLAWWDGGRLIPAHKVSGSDDLTTVTVSTRGYRQGSLTGVDAVFAVPLGKGTSPIPFRAWTAPPVGTRSSQHVQHVGGGLTLVVRYESGKSEGSTAVQLAQGPEAGPRLREGVYVLAQGNRNLGSYRVEAEHPDGPLRSLDGAEAPFQYVILRVERV